MTDSHYTTDNEHVKALVEYAEQRCAAIDTSPSAPRTEYPSGKVYMHDVVAVCAQ